jgi:hypothetical protein
MSKYHYLVNGVQEGPVSLEELKDKSISRKTMVWYEGIDEWTQAEKIEELRTLIINNENRQDEEKPGDSLIWKAAKWIGILVLIILAVKISFTVLNNPHSNSYINVDVHPPSPTVVESHAGEDQSSRLFAYREAVYATVINQGGSGRVLVTAQLTQGGNLYERTKEVYINANQSQEVHFVFTEPKALGGSMTFSVAARAL